MFECRYKLELEDSIKCAKYVYIGFGIAPRINAAGRISDSLIAVNLLLEDDALKAKAYAEELCEINRRRQIEENKIAEQAYEMIENEYDFKNNNVIIV